MSRLSNTTNYSALLDDLSRFSSGGAAEVGGDDNNLLKFHLPIHEHRRTLDRDTLLVLGGRGVGKTQLFRVLNVLKNPADLIGNGHEPDAVTKWKPQYTAGFTISGTGFPRTEVLEEVRSHIQDDPGCLWLGLLIGVLLRLDSTHEIIQERLNAHNATVLVQNLSAPSQWLPIVRNELEQLYLALDNIDRNLGERGISVTITYDDLDLLAARLSDAYPLIRALLAFWLRGLRRWKAIRCKIFLRTDIFAAEELAFPDSSKLRPLSVTLKWSADNLYRLVLKRLLNGEKQHDWTRFLSLPSAKVHRQEPWGIVPRTDERDHRGVVERMIGKYMGTDKRRGDTYQWFLNHLQDSRGDIAPRSFLKLFEFAARRQLEQPAARTERLLTPEQVNGALMEVSQDRITELREEFRWIDALKEKLRGTVVPMERGEFRKFVRGVNPKHLPEHIRESIDAQIDYLIGLGILRQTDDGRIHVPDIYLFGFNLKRKGGIRRPRA